MSNNVEVAARVVLLRVCEAVLAEVLAVDLQAVGILAPARLPADLVNFVHHSERKLNPLVPGPSCRDRQPGDSADRSTACSERCGEAEAAISEVEA